MDIFSDPVLLARLQFACTAAYHFIFVPLTIGLGLILAINETRYYRSRDPKDAAATKFWVKIFTATFVLGLATGITMEFSFGTNWADYSRFVGDIFGAPLAAEALLAFFLESTFLGVLLFGRKRVSPKFYMVSAWLVWFGSALSALWILIANSWMQTPAGAELSADGSKAVITDFLTAAMNPSVWPRYSHTIVAVLIMGAFVAMAVSAWYLIKNRHKEFAMKTMKLGAVVGIVAGALAVLVLMLPLNWQAIAHARAVQLRPELALTAEQARKQLATQTPQPQQSPKSSASPTQTAQPQVSALKVPNNLDPSRWQCDAAAQQCSARMLMIGDSVTAGVAQTLQQHFPQAHIDGAVSRQFATGEDLLAQFLGSGEDPQVIVFALGTNGAATREQAEHVVQLAAGRPLYFVTALAPVDWTAASNATFQEVAAAHPNVGIIDWSALATAHPEYLYDDGTHPNELGTQAYEQQLYNALCPRD